MDTYLRDNQETTLLDRAHIVSTIVEDHRDLFVDQTAPAQMPSRRQHLYVRPLDSPIQLDGYADDWHVYERRRQKLGTDHMITGNFDPASLKVTYRLGSFHDYLFILFEITDDHIVYRTPNSPVLHESDEVQISIERPNGDIVHYFLATSAPGWVKVRRIQPDTLPATGSRYPPIKAEWQETRQGYNVEIQIPIAVVGDKLGFAINDIDNPRQRKIEQAVGTVSVDKARALGTIVVPSPEIETLLKRLDRPSSRTWVIDRNYRVIAMAGDIATSDNATVTADDPTFDSNSDAILPALLRLFYRFVLKQPTTEFVDDLSTASRLEGEEIAAALAGDPASRWRQTPDRRVNILTAAYPVHAGNSVIGAVAIEETSNSILAVQNRAMEILINLSMLTFVIATFTLLAFATRLSVRIRRLRNQTDSAITADGRVHGEIAPSRSRDEIGDLSRSFSDLVSRVGQYNLYLETMASKLSHELRTPITVVRSSLENLSEATDSDAVDTYLHRAGDGIKRLDNILSRMSEATRLEQTLQQENYERFDMANVVQGCIEGYKLAHPEVKFEFKHPPSKETPLWLMGSPDLIAQMLDKLIANAIDFHKPMTPVTIELFTRHDEIILNITNEGPPLPEHMQHSLFDSMVSVRTEKGEQPHLGLGLYIVRLITQFHKGSVSGENHAANHRVTFMVELPLCRS